MGVDYKSVVGEGEHGDVAGTVSEGENGCGGEVVGSGNELSFFDVVELVCDVASIGFFGI